MMRMFHYWSRNADGTIHVQNTLAGMMGQHHVHDAASWKAWKKGTDPSAIKSLGKVKDCDCGLKPGEVRSGAK